MSVGHLKRNPLNTSSEWCSRLRGMNLTSMNSSLLCSGQTDRSSSPCTEDLCQEKKKRQPCIDRDRSEKHRWWLASSWHHARNSFNKHWVLELRIIRLRTTCRRREQIHRSSFCRLYGEDEYGRKIVYANICVSMSVLMSEWKDISFHTFLFAVWNFHSREWCPIREISLRLHLLYSSSPWVAYHYTRVLLVVLLG